ncbi:MAG: TonB-dependent receptor plug domain-containing protein, partial [Alistipes finegoldii]
VIDVRLEEDALMVDDVVVIGYGTQSRRTITAAVSKVDGEKLAGAPVNSIGDALKGRVGGVRVSSADNQPGSDPVFLIRGGSSINQSNAPIIIIDGVNREMTGLNPNDIESIEVLKDAASAGIYGARASNGVILVTTKKGNRAKVLRLRSRRRPHGPRLRRNRPDGRPRLCRHHAPRAERLPRIYLRTAGAHGCQLGRYRQRRFVDLDDPLPAGGRKRAPRLEFGGRSGRSVEDHRFQDNDQQSQWFDDSYWMQYYVGVNGGSDK